MGTEDDDRRRIGRYELIEEIGRGGMAVVYRALDTSLGREVALKLLHPHLASHTEARRRFQREAQAVARLRHDAIIEVYDYSGENADDVYIVMELVKGTILRQVLQRHPGGPLPAEAAALIAREVFSALSEAHTCDVVHRDVKPENILISESGAIKLTDFGIAHLAGLDQMTVTGQILGSPAYMSPEHIEKAVLDARADIFSAGTLLYEMAVGVPPFSGQNPHQIIKRIIEGYFDHPLSVRPAVGHHLAGVIMRCMQIEPERRYQEAADVVRDLDSALAAVGISGPQQDLPGFFADPERWWAAREPLVVDRTLTLGQVAFRARCLPAAMDHFNRILALDPGNERALDAVAGLSRRRRIRRFFERSAVLLAVLVAFGGLIAGVVLAFGNATAEQGANRPVRRAGRAELRDEPRPEQDGARAGKNAGSAEDGKERGTDAGPAASRVVKPLDLQLTMRPVTVKPPNARHVLFVPHPQAVDIVVDGERFRYSHLDNERELTVGPHEVQFVPNSPEAEARFEPGSWTIDIPEGAEPFKLRKRLRWLPARLRVACEVDAEVTVLEQGVIGRTNKPIKLDELKDPNNQGEERVSVLVRAGGYLPVTKQVTIVAGETVETQVVLQADAAATP
ncbi:MAG TPA: serine/threonine-protein kinase [Polyangia bacterium]|nr:serine/threonine-protein kinase [Polyangia bacterium]